LDYLVMQVQFFDLVLAVQVFETLAHLLQGKAMAFLSPYG